MKLSLSMDGGATFGTVLAASTPNDGSHDVTLPNLDTSQARIKVEAVGNYFFDVNDAAFSIDAAAGRADGRLAVPPSRVGPAQRRARAAFSASSTDADSSALVADGDCPPG